MKKITKKIVVWLLICMLVLSGCSSSNNAGKANENSSAPASDVTSTPNSSFATTEPNDSTGSTKAPVISQKPEEESKEPNATDGKSTATFSPTDSTDSTKAPVVSQKPEEESKEPNATDGKNTATFNPAQSAKPTKEPIVTQEPDILVDGKITFTYGPAAVSAGYKAAADRFISAFEKKYPDVEVERDYTATSDTRIAAGDIGDVFYFSDDQAYEYAVSDEALLPLDGFVKKFDIDLSDVYSGIYASGLVNGRLYFVPFNYNQIALIYNKTALEAAGVSSSVKPEWTWEEFQALCEQLASDDYYPIELNLAYSPVYTAFFEAYTHRNSWCSTTEKKITFIDEDGNILRAVKEALTLAEKGYAMFPGINDFQESFQGKEPIFKTCVYPQVQDQGKKYESLDIEWDVINMPLFQNPSFGCGSSGVGVFSKTGNVTAATALALFLFTPEGQKTFNAGQGGSVPLLKSIDAEGYDAWKYPDDENWSQKNWDAFVYRADTASTPGQVNCRMPIDVAEIINRNVRNILAQHLSGATNYFSGFATLEKKCNEKWALLT